MSQIRSKNTSLDRAMEAALREAGIAHEIYPRMRGSPDFLVEGEVAVFCDSSFWHGRKWPSLRKKLAAGNHPDYWVGHIKKNRERDLAVSTALMGEGFIVLRFWDDEVLERPGECIEKIRGVLVGRVGGPGTGEA